MTLHDNKPRAPFFLLLLAVGWTALFVFGCSSSSSQNSQTIPENPGPPSKPDKDAVAQRVSGASIWRGDSEGFEIEWTVDDLFLKSGEKVERIFQPIAKRGYDEFLADLNKDAQTKEGHNCDYRRQFAILSIVGPLLTFEDNEYSDCGGAHPTTDMRFVMIDLRRQGEVFYKYDNESIDVDLERPGKAVKLTDYFTEADILNALLADRVIGQALINAGVSQPPRTLAELPELFAKDDYVLSDTELSLRPDFLTRFAFHHIERDMVAVRLHLPSIAFAYRSKQLGLLLPIPPLLRQPLGLAAKGQQGFLMGEVPHDIRNQFTRFAFKIGDGARRN
jgi:hypothetical protein